MRIIAEDYSEVVEIWLNTGGPTRYDDLHQRIDYNDQYFVTHYDPHRDPQWKNVPPEIWLAHELIHALHHLEGTLCQNLLECVAPAIFNQREEHATVGLGDCRGDRFTENRIRSEYANTRYFPGILQRPEY